MNRLETVIQRRSMSRLASARGRSARIVDDAADLGIEISIVGSLARSDFRVHSDIDFLVRGAVDTARRVAVERLVAGHMRGTDIPYDIIYEADISPERMRELLDDCL